MAYGLHTLSGAGCCHRCWMPITPGCEDGVRPPSRNPARSIRTMRSQADNCDCCSRRLCHVGPDICLPGEGFLLLQSAKQDRAVLYMGYPGHVAKQFRGASCCHDQQATWDRPAFYMMRHRETTVARRGKSFHRRLSSSARVQLLDRNTGVQQYVPILRTHSFAVRRTNMDAWVS